MSLPKTEQTPDDPENLPAARRRRAQRTLLPQKESEHETFLDRFGHRVSPTFDFFFFSLIGALVLSLGVWVDSPSLLVLGALLAPLMAPLIGLSLGSVTGSMRFFTRSLVGLLIASAIVLVVGFIAGLAAFSLMPSPIEIIQAYYHARLDWSSFLVLAMGSVLTTLWLVRNRRSAAVASVALSYELFVPLTVAGFGLGAGLDHLWPDGLVVFSIYLASSALLSAVTLLFLGFRPLTIFGYTLGGAMLLLGIVAIIGLSGAGVAIGGQVALPTPIPSLTPTPTLTLTPSLTPSATSTPLPPTDTPTLTVTPSITPSPTLTFTPSPTPIYAVIAAEEGGGAILRAQPGWGTEQVTSVLNGTTVQIIDEKPADVDGTFWLNVRIPDGREGWMLQTTLLVATPAPVW
jgi:hypothetical protein